MSTEVPTWAGVVASVALVLLAAVITGRERLGITRELLVAALRAFIQLVAVGAVLSFLFTRAGVLGALVWLAAMVAVASVEAARRARGLPGALRTAATGIGTGTATTLGILVALQVVDTEPRVLVPVGGMVVAGSMQVAALVLRGLRATAATRRAAVEARLSLGMTAGAAFAPYAHDTVRTALVPAIDTTKVVGLISLPGAMTGLILAGVDPLTAIRYQIVVMYMLLAAAAVTGLVTARVASRALFDEAQRLRPVIVP